ncbi:MAG: hypothetical protein ABEJ23_01860 [Haloarculaceae archaeon]
MPPTLTLPNGETIAPGEVILYEGYPYRYVASDDPDVAFVLSPLFWGDSPLDVPFSSRAALADQWGAESRGTLTEAEWADWLADAREDERFGAAELDAVASEVLADDRNGVLARVRRFLGR